MTVSRRRTREDSSIYLCMSVNINIHSETQRNILLINSFLAVQISLYVQLCRTGPDDKKIYDHPEDVATQKTEEWSYNYNYNVYQPLLSLVVHQCASIRVLLRLQARLFPS